MQITSSEIGAGLRAESPLGYVEWKRWHASEFGRFSVDEAMYFRHEMRASGLPSLAGLRVAELGYGNGAFAGWARSEGAAWIGREAIPELVERATRSGFEAISLDTDLSRVSGRGALNLIVAFDVVEHLDLTAIRAFFAEARHALTDDGLLVVRVPSGDSPFSSAIFNGDLTHRTLLGSGAVRQLAKESGFDVLQLRAPALPLWGFGPARLIRRVVASFLQRIGYWFVRHFLMGHGTAVVSPNMIVVLKKGNHRP